MSSNKYIVVWEQRSFTDKPFDQLMKLFSESSDMEKFIMSLVENREIESIDYGTPVFRLIFIGKIQCEWKLSFREMIRDGKVSKEIIWNEL